MASVIQDIIRFFYPHTCVGCGKELYNLHHFACTGCLKSLPLTGFERTGNNYTETLFAGRLPLKKACSWLFFEKDSLTQKLIHQLKYRNNQAIGEWLGYAMGKQLMEQNWFNTMDVVVPLPLNKRKLNMRGYNQSEVLCRGISSATGLPVEKVAVMRTVYTETQTKKSRIQRWRNVEEVFDLIESTHLQGKHALLVDDVVTTGATLDACGQVLLKVPGLSLSVLTLAVASKI
jgi:ComF family protein